MKKFKKGMEFIMCCGVSGCPSIKHNGVNILIKDDYGNKVQLSIKEWNYLVKNIQKDTVDFISN